MTDLGLQGKTVIVTGAAGGLGRSFAAAFGAAGAKVVAADIDEPGACETAALIQSAGGTALGAGVDVTSRDSCAALAQKAHQDFGTIDALINNAALYGALTRAPFEDIDEAVWDQVMAVNIKGVWQMSRAVSPLLPAGGAIVNIASATVFSGSPEWMHYVASKGAVIAMTRVMAKELGPREIRANVIAPGITMTDASDRLFENARTYGAGRAALKRNAEVDDITGAALYLVSPLSGFMTGQTMVIDGGKQFI